MKTGEAVLTLLSKYKFKKEITAEIREKMLFSKNKIHNEIINKKRGGGAKVNRGKEMKANLIVFSAAAAAVAVIAAVLMVIFGGNLQDRRVNDALVARAVFVTGNVLLKRGDALLPLKQGDTVKQGDHVVTGDSSFASLQVSELGVIKVSANTEFSFTGINSAGNTELNLNEGAVYSNLKKLGKNQSYKINTRTYTASVRGTEFLTLAGKRGNGVRVLSGAVNVSTSSSSSDVTEKKGVNVSDQGAISEYKLTELDLLELKKESLFRYIENLKGTDSSSLDQRMKEINDQIAQIDAEIANLAGKTPEKEKLSPLDRLRQMNKPLTMVYLRDGSQIAGSVTGQKNGRLKIDTGEGLIEIPVEDIVRRMPIK